MRYLSPQTAPSSKSQVDVPASYAESVIAPEVATAIALLTAQINTLHLQINEMRHRLNELEASAYPIDQRYRAPDPENTVYSPIVKLSFRAIKLLFLFSAGFVLAYILASSLGGGQITSGLQGLMSVWLMPLAALTFCTIAIATIVESLK